MYVSDNILLVAKRKGIFMKKIITIVSTKSKTNKQIQKEVIDNVNKYDAAKSKAQKPVVDDVTLRNEYLALTGIDLPIIGGFGISEEQAVVIQETRDAYAIQIEYAILRYYAAIRECKYKVVEQTYFHNNGKSYDKIKIAWPYDDEHYFNYYFDITASNRKPKENTITNTEITFVPKITPYMKDLLKKRN